MSTPIYELELKEIRRMLALLNQAGDGELVSFREDTVVSLSVERGEHGKATPAGHLVYDGVQWLYQG